MQSRKTVWISVPWSLYLRVLAYALFPLEAEQLLHWYLGFVIVGFAMLCMQRMFLSLYFCSFLVQEFCIMQVTQILWKHMCCRLFCGFGRFCWSKASGNAGRDNSAQHYIYAVQSKWWITCEYWCCGKWLVVYVLCSSVFIQGYVRCEILLSLFWNLLLMGLLSCRRSGERPRKTSNGKWVELWGALKNQCKRWFWGGSEHREVFAVPYHGVDLVMECNLWMYDSIRIFCWCSKLSLRQFLLASPYTQHSLASKC